MRHWIDSVTNPTSQIPAAGVQVAVYPHGSGTLAAIYADAGITIKANPLTTDSTGSYDFYIADGRYDINISGANIIPKTLSDVSIFDITSTETTGAVVIASDQPGADACAQINAALAIVPASGGVVDARGIIGSQSCGSTIVVSKPVDLQFGAITLTGPASGDVIRVTVGGTRISGCGRACTTIKPQTSAQAHGIHGTNTGGTSFIIRDLAIQDSSGQSNPSLSTRTAGAGIQQDHNSGGASSWGQLENVDVRYMFNGYDLDNPITTMVTGGWLLQNVQDGVHWVGGTSTNFNGTYGNANGRYNWFISGVTYSSLNGTASDSAGLNHPTYTIASISSASNVVTVTTTLNTPIVGHQWITILGVTDSSFNGNFEAVSSNGTNQFTYALTGGDRSSSGGTATVEGIGYFCNQCVGVSFNGVGTEVSTGLGVSLLNSNGITFAGRVLNSVDHAILVEGSRDISLFGYNTGSGTNGTGYGVYAIPSLGAFGSNSSSATLSVSITNYGMALSVGSVNISTISRTANVVTVQTAAPHGLISGNMVNVAGVATSSFNGWFVVQTATDSTHFTYNQNGGNQNDTTGRSERDVQAASGVFQSFMENSFSGFGAIYTDQMIKASQQGLNLNLGGNSTGFIGLNTAQGTGSGGVKIGDGSGVNTFAIIGTPQTINTKLGTGAEHAQNYLVQTASNSPTQFDVHTYSENICGTAVSTSSGTGDQVGDLISGVAASADCTRGGIYGFNAVTRLQGGSWSSLSVQQRVGEFDLVNITGFDAVYNGGGVNGDKNQTGVLIGSNGTNLGGIGLWIHSNPAGTAAYWQRGILVDSFNTYGVHIQGDAQQLVLDTKSATTASTILFKDQNTTSVATFGKTTGNDVLLFDSVNSKNRIFVETTTNTPNSKTRINSVGTGDVRFNVDSGSGTGGSSFGDGAGNSKATISSAGLGTFAGIAVSGTNTITLGSVAFASLGTPANGNLVYCSDCTISNPCASGGTGALAKRLNGIWVCN